MGSIRSRGLARVGGVALTAALVLVACGCGDDDTGGGGSGASVGGSGGSGVAGGGGIAGSAGAGGAAGAGGDWVEPPDCTHYASVDGGGDGSSEGSPFAVADFWPVAQAGDTLCLLDGAYRGADAMIAPPFAWDGQSCTSLYGGTQSAPITIAALHDGAVELDGEGERVPIRLGCAAWVVVAGVDAHSSSSSVVSISRSQDVLVRRVVAWDANDENTDVFGVHYGARNVLEDVAGFGVARKTMSCSQGGDECVCRRCWLRWEGCTNIGPKMSLSMWYNSLGELAENVIATWDNGSMPDVYTTQNNGELWTGNFAGTHTGGEPDQAYGLFSRDRNDDTTVAQARIFGSIGYLRGAHRYDPGSAYFLNGEDEVSMENSVAYAEPGNYDGVKPFWLYGPANGSQGIGLEATDLSGIGVTDDDITAEWVQTDVEHASSAAELGDSVFVGDGARVCYEYVDGVETTTPLWPWRMNGRILAATTRAAAADHHHYLYQGNPPTRMLVNDPHEIEDVTATIEAMFGPIPSACRRW